MNVYCSETVPHPPNHSTPSGSHSLSLLFVSFPDIFLVTLFIHSIYCCTVIAICMLQFLYLATQWTNMAFVHLSCFLSDMVSFFLPDHTGLL